MMQVTRAAFQVVANLNEQATDPKSHTLVKNVYTSCSLVPLPANSDGRPQAASLQPNTARPKPADATPRFSLNRKAIDNSCAPAILLGQKNGGLEFLRPIDEFEESVNAVDMHARKPTYLPKKLQRDRTALGREKRRQAAAD